jgi:hypothetical protein
MLLPRLVAFTQTVACAALASWRQKDFCLPEPAK